MEDNKRARPSPQKEQLSDSSILVGELDQDGFAHLLPPSKIIAALADRPNIDRSQHSSESAISTATSEDYDKLAVDPSTVIEGSSGGGLESKPQLPPLHTRPGELQLDGSNERKRPRSLRKTSIPIKLQKTATKGKYMLSVDEPEIREILKQGIERERGEVRRRSTIRDLVFTRQFTTFDRQNPTSAASPFHGFFVLAWLGIAFLIIKLAASNWRACGNIMGENELLTLMFQRDVVSLCVSDCAMMLGTLFGFGLQKLVYSGWLSWDGSAWIIQGIWQFFYIWGTISWAMHQDWAWTHTVFIVLHCLVMLMKQHSYAFYNGHLSEVYKRKKMLESKLKQLDDIELENADVLASPLATAIATTYLDTQDTAVMRRHRRRQSKDPKSPSTQHTSAISLAKAIESGDILDAKQIGALSSLLESEIESLSTELKGKCSTTSNYYPQNLNLKDALGYIPLPTVVYELEYPRQERIDWFYVAEKAMATFGVIAVMTLVSQAYIYPIVMQTVAMKASGLPLAERIKEFPWILSDLLFPFMLEYLLAWYVIWECTLNLLAELTLFADRGFYADWWNSTSWDQFARDWNVPVHNFLLRHVYHSSISAWHVSKPTATLVTFLLSAVVHELVMYCIFKKLRGYLMVLQMSQLPLVMLARTRMMRERKILGNIMFWLGIFTAPSLLCSLYLII